MTIIIAVILLIVFAAIDFIMVMKFHKKFNAQIDGLLELINETTKKVEAIEKSKTDFEKTTEKISKEHKMLKNEINKTNEALTIFNNGLDTHSYSSKAF